MRTQSRNALIIAAITGTVIVVALAADVGIVEFVGEPPQPESSVLDVEMTGFRPTARSIGAHAPSTGTAVYADAVGGVGVIGLSQGSYGVRGTSTDSWGGFFTSAGGYGIRVDTSGTDHYDHGAYITSAGGYAVYAQSESNMAVRGEAGDVAGLSIPLGTVGVVGIGSSRGLFGSSGNGVGAYGTSNDNYGVWGRSQAYRGVTGRTDRPDNNYGLYTPDNIFASSYQLTGAIMRVVQNAGAEPLEKGDVVVFAGVKRPGLPDDLRSADPEDRQAQVAAALEVPIVRVARATTAASQEVAGVVFSRYDLAALDPDETGEGASHDQQNGEERAAALLEVTPAGPAARGDYLLIVVQGPAEVKADYAAVGIAPGTPLVAGFSAGRAASAADVLPADLPSAPAGSMLGKALEAPHPGAETIYAYVALQ
jgi:hypothetical protein